MELESFLKTVFGGYEQYGLLYALGAGLSGLVALLRSGPIQQALPAKLRWSGFPQWLKYLAPFALAAVGSALIAVATGTSGVAAVVMTAITGGVATIQHSAAQAPKKFPPPGPISPTSLVGNPATGEVGKPDLVGVTPHGKEEESKEEA